MADNQEHPE
jgi:hypothetical protein